MSGPDPGRVLRWALVGWGLGHVALGRTSAGVGLLAAEVIALLLLAWLAIGLADTSLYLVPFLAGIGFLVAWAAQAVAAYHLARNEQDGPNDPPHRSPALAMGWLTIPLLVWGAGFWLVAAGSGSPSAVLDRFVTAWTDDELDNRVWPSDVVATARQVADGLEPGPERFRDVRVRVADRAAGRATAVAEAIHYERRDSRLLGIFAGSELVPVADRHLLTLELVARPVELPGGGDIGAVRWEIVGARP
jgi:hypothetical protein